MSFSKKNCPKKKTIAKWAKIRPMANLVTPHLFLRIVNKSEIGFERMNVPCSQYYVFELQRQQVTCVGSYFSRKIIISIS
jgi:hypothetical protein